MTFSPRTETYVNVSSLTTPFNITVTKPIGTVDGDILFCWIGWYAAVTIDSVPTGWALLGQYIANTDRYALYYKIASGEGASWIWSFTATAKVRAVCSCYTGGDFDPVDPIDFVSNTPYRTSDLFCLATSMTVTSVNSPLVFWGGVYYTTSRTFTKPTVPTSGWVEDDDYWHTTADFGVEVCSMIWGGSGPTTDMSATMSGTATTKHAFAVALKPVGGGATYTRTLDEVLQVYDVVAKTGFFTRPLNEALNAYDVASRAKILLRQFNEAIQVYDAFSRSAIFTRQPKEVLEAYDAFNKTTYFTRPFNEILEAYDAAARKGALTRTLSETLELYDPLSKGIQKLLSETLQVYDALTGRFTPPVFFRLQFNEGIQVFDAVAKTATFTRQFNEMLQLYDALTTEVSMKPVLEVAKVAPFATLIALVKKKYQP